MRKISHLGVLGAGVIGAGWAARASLCGLDVTVYDPSSGARSAVERARANAERAYRKMTLAPLSHSGAIKFAETPEALAEADWIQESLPERPELKIEVLAELSRYIPADVCVASSTSGLSPTLLQSRMLHPERFIVAHPFNPVYLMPLVELCGGARTSDVCKAAARAFYESIGMHVLLLKREVSGFIADRMMEALWREALWMVHDGVASVSDIDDALRYGPGLRWSFMGSFLTYRLAGGEGGMRHFLAHFAPSLEWDWTRLEAPPWSEALAEEIARQSDVQAGDRSVSDYELLRDDCLVSVLQALRGHNFAAGEVLARFDALLFDASHRVNDAVDISYPLVLHRCSVLPEWVDYNGHMTESRYLQVFGDASDALYRFVGCDSSYHAAHGSFYTAETHLRHLREVGVGVGLSVSSRVLGSEGRKLHIFHELYDGDEVIASCEQLAVHVGESVGDAVAERLGEIFAAHGELEKPVGVGRVISLVQSP